MKYWLAYHKRARCKGYIPSICDPSRCWLSTVLSYFLITETQISPGGLLCLALGLPASGADASK